MQKGHIIYLFMDANKQTPEFKWKALKLCLNKENVTALEMVYSKTNTWVVVWLKIHETI